MRFKILSLLAALVLVAACSTDPDNTSGASGTGGGDTTNAGAENNNVSGGVAGPVMGSEEDFITVGDRVFFGFDKSNLNSDAQSTLAKQAAWLIKYPQVTIQVEGHCDERGTREYNLALGERRANSVREYLISLGVSENRITTISYGKERPAVEGSNDEAWAQNRRGVTRIVSGAAS
ncbi:peptidoglycan-associated lipoprotein Pal [Aestuariispira insulae]|uniref:Peptidoglycan-associated lipoprotein n=1 Tax=Aestuariispira insulae TaxID=1461337 RepID=A0A3D9HKH8_9PROT|nr:peptidoglycan-associated lipoprotein Pal [Aestuariispira insulae]RED49791.1 peptidoglycan-associated lipoprotein [Aestuariispira insulae]